MQIYVHKNNQQTGPFTEAEIQAQLAAHTITLQDHVWWAGQANWVPLGQTSIIAPGTTPLPVSPLPGGTASFAPAQTSQLAIWSLVCGCLSLICGLFAAIPAIVLGHLALGDIKRNPGRSGRGLAIAGLVIGYLLTAFFIVILCFYAALMPTILKAIKEQQMHGQTFVPLPSTSSPDDTSTNAPDQPTATPATNSPDSSTNSATATPVTPDQSSSSNSADSSTNAPGSSTNAAPMSQ